MITDAKAKSKNYFNTHRKSKLAHGGYWKHDYKYALSAIRRIEPDNLIDIGCHLQHEYSSLSTSSEGRE